MEDTDTEELGGDSLSVEQAAAAYVKATTAQEADEANPGEDELEDGDSAVETDSGEDEAEAEADEDEEDGNPDDEGDAEDETEDEPESEKGRFVAADGRVRLPDGSVATVHDLIQGNLKEKDYRQKTMQLAEQRKQFEQQSSVIKASEQEVAQQRQYMAELLQSIVPPPPDPQMANPHSPNYDPLGYQEAEVRHKAFMNHLTYLQQQEQAHKQKSEQMTVAEQQEKAGREWNTLQEALPELKDGKKAQAFVAEINNAALAHGFTPDEIKAQVPYDHRMALVLQKAAKWDSLQKARPKAKEKTQGKPPVIKGGKRLSPDARSAQQSMDALKRLKQTGTVEDAAAAYLASRK